MWRQNWSLKMSELSQLVMAYISRIVRVLCRAEFCDIPVNSTCVPQCYFIGTPTQGHLATISFSPLFVALIKFSPNVPLITFGKCKYCSLQTPIFCGVIVKNRPLVAFRTPQAVCTGLTRGHVFLLSNTSVSLPFTGNTGNRNALVPVKWPWGRHGIH